MSIFFKFCIFIFVLISFNCKSFSYTTVTPYFGGSFSKYKINYKESNGIDYKGFLPGSFNGYGGFIGFDFHKNISFEMGYDTTFAQEAVVNTYGVNIVKSKISTSRYDLLFKIPISPEYTLLLIGGIVQGVNTVRTETTSPTVDSRLKQGGYSTGIEYGIGLLKNLNDYTFLKFDYKRQRLNFNGIADGTEILSASIAMRLM